MKLREIERLRGVAILMVMVVHWDTLQKFLPDQVKGWAGVDLFFVISGYVVTLSLVRLLPALEDEPTFLAAFDRARSSLKTFYARRFFRIMPAALAVMLLYRFFITVFPDNFGTPNQWWGEALAFFGGVYNYTHPYHNEYRMGVYWSLAVEEHFYLILPMLFVIFRTTSRRLAACLGLSLVSIVCRVLPAPDGAYNLAFYEKFPSHLRFDSLMAGVALALVAGRSSSGEAIMPRWLMRFFILPAAVVLVACLPSAAPDHVMHRVGFISLWMISGLLVGFAGMDRGYVLSFPVVGRVLEFVGERSYALYLTHTLAGRVEDSAGHQWPDYRRWAPMDVPHPWKRLLVSLVLAFVAAEVIHRLVEKPLIRIGRGLVERKPGIEIVPRGTRRMLAVAATLLALFFCRHWLLRSFGPRNLALHQNVVVSSRDENGEGGPELLVNGELESESGMHTKREDNPWVIIDLGQPTRIGTIRIYNRADGYQEEQLPLEVAVSTRGGSFDTIAVREVMFTQAFPWRIRVNYEPVRYVRLLVPRTTVFTLSEVEIYESRWVASIE